MSSYAYLCSNQNVLYKAFRHLSSSTDLFAHSLVMYQNSCVGIECMPLLYMCHMLFSVITVECSNCASSFSQCHMLQSNAWSV